MGFLLSQMNQSMQILAKSHIQIQGQLIFHSDGFLRWKRYIHIETTLKLEEKGPKSKHFLISRTASYPFSSWSKRGFWLRIHRV